MDSVMEDELGNMNDNGPGIDQEYIPPEELDDEVPRSTNAWNPQAPHNNVQFSFKER